MGAEENITEVAKGALDAYKTNPLMTGLLLLNVGMFIGFGYYTMKVQAGTGVYIAKMQDDLLALAKECAK